VRKAHAKGAPGNPVGQFRHPVIRPRREIGRTRLAGEYIGIPNPEVLRVGGTSDRGRDGQIPAPQLRAGDPERVRTRGSDEVQAAPARPRGFAEEGVTQVFRRVLGGDCTSWAWSASCSDVLKTSGRGGEYQVKIDLERRRRRTARWIAADSKADTRPSLAANRGGMSGGREGSPYFWRAMRGSRLLAERSPQDKFYDIRERY